MRYHGLRRSTFEGCANVGYQVATARAIPSDGWPSAVDWGHPVKPRTTQGLGRVGWVSPPGQAPEYVIAQAEALFTARLARSAEQPSCVRWLHRPGRGPVRVFLRLGQPCSEDVPECGPGLVGRGPHGRIPQARVPEQRVALSLVLVSTVTSGGVRGKMRR